MKNINLMIISIDAEKVLTKSNNIYDKNPQQSGFTGNISQHNKGHTWQAHS